MSSSERKGTCGVCKQEIVIVTTDFIGDMPKHTPHECALYLAAQNAALQARVAALEAQLKTARERVEKARYTVSYSGVSPREAVNRAVLMLLADALAALRKEPK